MSNTHTPDLITTHQYIIEALEQLAGPEQHYVEHHLVSTVMEATAEVSVPHTFEAELKVPVQEDPETGQLKPKGTRLLKLELRTDTMPKRQEPIPGAATRINFADPEHEQRALATATLCFNTKEVKEAQGKVWYDGEQIGLNPASVALGTNKNLLLRYLAHFGEMRSLSVARAAEFITDVSMHNAQSVERVRSNVDIYHLARGIQQATGKAIPDSLRRPPLISYEGAYQLSSDEYAPTAAANMYTIDVHSKDRRTITRWEMAQYNGIAPVNAQTKHLGFYCVSTLDGEADGRSFGIDARQEVISLRSEAAPEDRCATTEAEARDMVKPFINAVAALRRYNTVAIRERLVA